jgi:hypothetical protein
MTYYKLSKQATGIIHTFFDGCMLIPLSSINSEKCLTVTYAKYSDYKLPRTHSSSSLICSGWYTHRSFLTKVVIK